MRRNAERKIPDEVTDRKKVAARSERLIERVVSQKTSKTSTSKTWCEMQSDAGNTNVKKKKNS